MPKLVSSPARALPIDQDHVPPRFCKCKAALTPTMPAPKTRTSALVPPSGTPVQFARLHVSGEKLVIARPPRKPACAAAKLLATMQLTIATDIPELTA